MRLITLQGPPETWNAQIVADSVVRARNWGLICGFGYGYAAAVLTLIILLFVT
jgi:hypothetical protein